MKRALPIFLALTLMLTQGLTVRADEPILTAPDAPIELPQNSPGIDRVLPDAAALAPIALYGFIVEEYDNGSILVQSDWDESNQVVLNIPDGTFVVDAVTGQATTLAARESDRVAVFYGPAATFSLPPISNAVAIAVNLPEDGRSPHYAKVEQITRSDDSVRILTGGGSLYITIGRDAPISPYRTRNLVTIDNLRVGSELMVWYDIVALSYPGQTSANRTVILRDGEPGEVITVYAERSEAMVGDSIDPLALTLRTNEDGATLLPLRLLCEALGYTVSWIPEDNAVEITRDETVITLTFDSPIVTVGDKTVFLPQLPEVENGTTYIPADFFQTVLNVDLFLR